MGGQTLNQRRSLADYLRKLCGDPQESPYVGAAGANRKKLMPSLEHRYDYMIFLTRERK